MQVFKQYIRYKNTKRKQIPKAIREQVWIQNFGNVFDHKCYIPWCENKINVFTYQVGHNIPVSKGGNNKLNNLKPICMNCNLSMSNKYTIDEWSKIM